MKEKCIICNKWDYWDVLMVKLPEKVFQCLHCADKYKDNNIYDWANEWRAIWIIWKGFLKYIKENETI